MKSMISGKWLALLIVSLILVVGCQPTPTERAETFSVTGTVTLNGEALEGSALSFVPNGAGDAASGFSDASGKYPLSTFGSEGAVPGEYSVKIVKYEGAAEDAAAGGGPTGDGEDEYPDNYDGGATDDEEEAENLLPAKYAEAATSGFTATVEANNNNNFDFALEE